ncbi:uncharacterized protein BDR25DRAFT_306864 [Lindgomyces ingoldianus]|uniref:Uncharacterized protein n=1 Tax=Lindgomyces ingoldianus TaxID=673940 RepID=A0ACB6QES7_9PLEO|nr:uncharacterized protein BDR25DRAFT_306864 [Lindgomyces ingoldianus]KAF2464995.1 hypothetical protein BDR25DRAFT_306864 [Lindgomyces ingoldianus]
MNGDGYSRDERPARSRNYSSRDDRRDRDRDRNRRRSRSPHRGSRRNDYEVDTYSSSRDFHARERDDTYARRERRDDRGWGGGDSYSRRDSRRDDDRGLGRRDRDTHDERGGRGGRRDRDRGDRDGGHGGGRDRGGRDNTPPFKKREKTPDLTDMPSIIGRQRRMTQWDIKPAGYDNITAEQSKLSGMFPLPGAPRAAAMDPSRLAAFMNQPSGSASNNSLKPGHGRQAKRLFVHNIPPSATSDSIAEYFNLNLNGLNVVSATDPCISAQLAHDRSYALLEFKAPEDATMALALDGSHMEGDDASNGQPDREGLSIRRPKDYIVPASTDDDYVEGQVSNIVKDSPNKVSVSNIPTTVDEESLQELLATMGPLKSFVTVQDTSSGEFRGIAFCEYVQGDNTTEIIEALNQLALGDGNLKVQRASIGFTQAAGLEAGVNGMTLLARSETQNDETIISRVICMLNMITQDEVMDRDAYEEIKEDVEEECSKYGKILDIKMPRPTGGSRMGPGVGKIYIKYDNVESGQKAMKALAGRKFSDRTVVVTFFSEELFDVNGW